MFITNQSRQTHENAPRSARTPTPYPPYPQSLGRATSDCRRLTRDFRRSTGAQVLSEGRPRRPKAEVSRDFRVTFFWVFSGF